MQSQRTERVIQHEPDGATADASPEVAFVEKADGKPSAAVHIIDIVEPRLADKFVIRFHRPGAGMTVKPLEPCGGLPSGHLRWPGPDVAVHAVDFGRDPERGTRIHIARHGLAKLNPDDSVAHAILSPCASADGSRAV